MSLETTARSDPLATETGVQETECQENSTTTRKKIKEDPCISALEMPFPKIEQQTGPKSKQGSAKFRLLKQFHLH